MRMSWQRAVATAGLLSALTAGAAPEERLAVIAGANIGSSEDEPLRYAEADANRFRDVLIELGDIRPDRAIVALGGSPEQLLQALTEARGRAAEIQRTGHRVVLLFYYSGHGDEDGLHLPRGTLPLADLRANPRAARCRAEDGGHPRRRGRSSRTAGRRGGRCAEFPRLGLALRSTPAVVARGFRPARRLPGRGGCPRARSAHPGSD